MSDVGSTMLYRRTCLASRKRRSLRRRRLADQFCEIKKEDAYDEHTGLRIDRATRFAAQILQFDLSSWKHNVDSFYRILAFRVTSCGGCRFG